MINIGLEEIDLFKVIDKLTSTDDINNYYNSIAQHLFDCLPRDSKDRLIKQEPHFIMFEANPSEDLCMHAVKTNGLNIKYIKNPSAAVRKSALSNTPFAATWIEQNNGPLSIEEEMLMIDNNPRNIQYIKNPSEIVLIYLDILGKDQKKYYNDF